MTGNILKAMISEISPTEQNEYHVISLVCETKKIESIETGQVGGWQSKMCEGGQKVQTLSYNINTSQGCDVQRRNYS